MISGIELFGRNAEKISTDTGIISQTIDPQNKVSWNFVLDNPQNIFKIRFLDTNGHIVNCFDINNVLIYSRLSPGEHNITNLTSFSAVLEPYYTLGKPESTPCINDTEYIFMQCFDSSIEKCPSIFNSVPEEIMPILNKNTSITEIKWNVLKRKNCDGFGDWLNCVNGVRKRTCKDTDKRPNNNCIEKEEICMPIISEWGEWSDCVSKSSKRSRTCIENGYIDSCKNISLIDIRNCSDYSLGDFSDFGPCVNGTTTKTRPCIQGFNSTNSECPPPESTIISEKKKCTVPPGNQDFPISPEYLPIIIPLILIAVITIIFLVVFLRKR